MFEQSLLGNSNTKARLTFFCSAALQAIVVGIGVLTSILFSSPLASRQLISRAISVWSPPSAPDKTVVKASRAATRPRFDGTRLMQPAVLPRHIAVIEDAPGPIAAPDVTTTAGIYGGFGIGPMPEIVPKPTSTTLTPPAARRPEPPPAQPPVPVGGHVQQSKLVYSPVPQYPPLAKQHRISGVVRLQAIISRDGSIDHLKVIGGHPLLISAALEAVARWRYNPTLLNGEPVEVVTEIEVHFALTP